MEDLRRATCKPMTMRYWTLDVSVCIRLFSNIPFQVVLLDLEVMCGGLTRNSSLYVNVNGSILRIGTCHRNAC